MKRTSQCSFEVLPQNHPEGLSKFMRKGRIADLQAESLAQSLINVKVRAKHYILTFGAIVVLSINKKKWHLNAHFKTE
jgi:hypothetical protein